MIEWTGRDHYAHRASRDGHELGVVRQRPDGQYSALGYDRVGLTHGLGAFNTLERAKWAVEDFHAGSRPDAR